MKNLDLKAYIAVFFVMMFWSAGLPIISLGLNVEKPFAFLETRFIISSISIFIFSIIRKEKLLFAPKIMFHLFGNSIFVFSQFIFFYYGIKYTLAQRANIIVNLNPIFIIIFAHFFLKEEKLSPIKIFGIFIAFSGVFILFVNKNIFSINHIYGDLFILLSAISISTSTIYTRYLSKKVNLTALLFWQIFFATIIVEIIMLLLDIPFGNFLNIYKIFHIYLYLAICTNFIAPMLWFYLIKHYKLSPLAVISFVFPVMSAFFCYIILNEPLTEKLFMSLFLVCGGITIVQVKSS